MSDAARSRSYHAMYRERNKERIRAQRAAFRAANKERLRLAQAKWFAANRDKQVAANAAWHARHPDRTKAGIKAWHKAHPEVRALKAMRRRGMESAAFPTWANRFFIAEAYDLARRRSAATGHEWQVDHIVPIMSQLVCGLHVENNLRVIPARLNAAKGNRHWPDMPTGGVLG